MTETQRLFDEFRLEVSGDRHWGGEFTPSPFEPERKLRELVDGAGAAAAPLLLDALTADRDLRFWACVGLGWLGPAAGDAAAGALVEHVRARRDPLPTAAVALDAVAPARARELGVHRWPETMDRLTDRYADRGTDALADYVEWFVAEHADDDVVRFLGQRRLRNWMCHDCPARAADLLRDLLRGDRGAEIRRAVAEMLALSGVEAISEELIEALCHGGPLSKGVVDRVAAHPSSDRLVPAMVGVPAAASSLAALVMRRRCAGLDTDPEPLRAFLRAYMEEPPGRWPGPRYGDAVPTAVAALGDETMLEYLVPMLHVDRPATTEWNAVIRAFATFGAHGRLLLQQQARRHPDVERIRWALDEVDRYLAHDRRLDDADDAFLRGRVETSLGGAFASYGHALLLEPSAHAAFQLAWIDRAFGAPVTAERVAWIRALGFADEALLADVTRPVERPLDGHRFRWDRGESRQPDPGRAASAAAAGLPAVAMRWCRDDTYERAAWEHLERVRRAAPA